MLALILYLLGVVLITLEAFSIRPPRVSLGWLGLAILAFTALLLPHLTRTL